MTTRREFVQDCRMKDGHGFTPVVRNYTVDNLRSGKSKHALDVQGLATAPIFNLLLKNCAFDNVAEGNVVKNVRDATLDNVKINGRLEFKL